MKERPIPFNGEMVRAVLAGTKTQTRRIVKERPVASGVGWNQWWSEKAQAHVKDEHYAKLHCPYGVPGDRLWVRETHATSQFDGRPARRVAYRADGTYGAWSSDGEDRHFIRHGQDYRPFAVNRQDRLMHPAYYGDKWRPSIHMPRWASRITLEVADVRVERVQDISEADAKAEGISPLFSKGEIGRGASYRADIDIDPMPWTNYLWHGRVGLTRAQIEGWHHQYSSYKTAIGSFSSLWELINADRGFGWAENPWVWVVEFKGVEGEGQL